VATSVVVCGILLSTDEELGVEELSVLASTDLVDRRRVEVDEDGARDVLVVAGLGEEGLKSTWIADVGVGIRATICFQAMFEEIAGLRN
jgi:hypothetical protein